MKRSEFILYTVYAFSALFALYIVLDLLTVIFSGDTIEGIISGDSGPVVSLIVDKLPNISPMMFIVISIIAVIALSAIFALLIVAMIYPLLKQKAASGVKR